MATAQNLIEGLNIATGDVKTVIRWSRMLFLEALYSTFFSKFAGEGPQNAFQIVTDLSKEPGDQVRYDLLVQLTGYGQNANSVLLGNEKSLTYYQQALKVQQKREAHGRYRLSQQRTVHRLRKDAMRNLSEWFARVLDEHMFAWLCGKATASGLEADMDAFYSITGGPTVQDASHITNAGTKAFTPDEIDLALFKAKTVNPKIQPLRVEGAEHYVMFLTSQQAHELNKNSDFRTAQRDAGLRGRTNPIFTGAMGMWHGVVLHESNYLPVDTAATPDRHYAVLVGKQAAVVALGNAVPQLDSKAGAGVDRQYGIPFFWNEEMTDYGNRMGIAGTAIFGMTRTIFNSASFASYVVTTDQNVI